MLYLVQRSTLFLPWGTHWQSVYVNVSCEGSYSSKSSSSTRDTLNYFYMYMWTFFIVPKVLRFWFSARRLIMLQFLELVKIKPNICLMFDVCLKKSGWLQVCYMSNRTRVIQTLFHVVQSLEVKQTGFVSWSWIVGTSPTYIIKVFFVLRRTVMNLNMLCLCFTSLIITMLFVFYRLIALFRRLLCDML